MQALEQNRAGRAQLVDALQHLAKGGGGGYSEAVGAFQRLVPASAPDACLAACWAALGRHLAALEQHMTFRTTRTTMLAVRFWHPVQQLVPCPPCIASVASATAGSASAITAVSALAGVCVGGVEGQCRGAGRHRQWLPDVVHLRAAEPRAAGGSFRN